MNLTLRIWRQHNTAATGGFETYQLNDVEPDMSLLELLDRLNETLIEQGTPAVVFDSDCREGVCGACGITVDGRPHGPEANTPSCRQHLRSFRDRARITLEPLRSAAFAVLSDLAVDRSALDRLIEAGGFVSLDAGTGARALAMTTQMDADFGPCSTFGECATVCPAGIPLTAVAAVPRETLRARLTRRPD